MPKPKTAAPVRKGMSDGRGEAWRNRKRMRLPARPRPPVRVQRGKREGMPKPKAAALAHMAAPGDFQGRFARPPQRPPSADGSNGLPPELRTGHNRRLRSPAGTWRRWRSRPRVRFSDRRALCGPSTKRFSKGRDASARNNRRPERRWNRDIV